MNKSELVRSIAESADLTQNQAKAALDAAVNTVKETLAKGDKVIIPGIATLQVVNKPRHAAINPLTKQPMVVEEKNIIKFKAGSELTKAVN